MENSLFIRNHKGKILRYLMFAGLFFSLFATPFKVNAGGTNYTWVGTTSDWTLATNWTPNGMPTSADNVIINTVISPKVYPTITNGQTVNASNLTISTGATLNMTGGTFNFYHDWKNSGTFNATGGTLVFLGSAGGGATWNTGTNKFFNVQINSGIDPHFYNDPNGALSVQGNWIDNNTGLLTVTNAYTITFNGASQTILTSRGTNNSFINLRIGDGISATNVTLASNINMVAGISGGGGVLTVKAGSTFGLSTFNLGTTTAPTSVEIECGATTGSSITGSGTLALGGDLKVTNAASGSNGATLSCPVSLGATRIFTVADDGTSAPDLTLSGVISGSTFGVTKMGSGTMILTNPANIYTGATTITAGELRLNPVSTTASFSSQIVLNGGTLSTSGILTNTVFTSTSTLKLNSNSTIALGSNIHSLKFANSNSIIWAGSTLNITGWSGTTGSSGTAGKIFAGSDATGLAPEQLAKISINSTGVAQMLSTGEIVLGVLPQIVISSPDPAIAAGNILQNTTNNVIYRFDITVTSNHAIISGLQITTAGTYSSTDLTNLKAWYSADNSFNPSTDVLLSTKTSSLQAVTQIFPDWTRQLITSGTTGYFFITSDIPCVATAGSTININPLTTSDVTFVAGIKSGSTYAGGAQTLQNTAILNVTGASASAGIAKSVLTWTNPTGCYNEVMIVAKAGSAITATPTGDGSAYTANLIFGSGTGFDGGYVVYRGSASPQTITGLTNGTTYYFTFFTRNGTSWSSGITVNATPVEALSGDYRSVASGNWDALGTWQSYNGSNWVAAVSTPTSASGNITIRNGHIVTVAATLTVDQVEVETGGQVILNTGGTLTIIDGNGIDFVVNGIFLNMNGTITVNSGAILAFNNGGTYNHNRNGGPVPTATWALSSNCEITGVTGTVPTTSSLNQTFGNFTWNCTGQTAEINLGGFPSAVNGTFTVVSTGSGNIRPNGNPTYGSYLQTGGIFAVGRGGTPYTVTVTNDFSISNGTFYINWTDNNANGTVIVNRDFSMSGGTLRMTSGTNTKIGTLFVARDFYHAAGTIEDISTSTGSGEIVFNGYYNGTTGMQTYTSGGTVSNTVNFSVSSDAYLQMAAAGTVITGSGSFTLSSGATLGITSTDGITSDGATGNIQVTGTRNFSTGANYIYNGTATQNTGNGLPATVNNLLIKNTGGNVTFNTAYTITNNFSITASSVANLGTFSHAAGALTLGGVGQVSGSYGSSSSPATYKNDTYFAPTTGIVNVFGCTIGTWTGVTSTDWNTTSNWCAGILPTSGTNVIVISSANYQPVVSNSPTALPTAVCNNLTINSGASVTINAGQAVSVGGNISNSGTLYLKSDGNGIASLKVDGTSPVAGTNIIEIYLSGGGAPSAYKWHYISSPVDNTPTSIFTNNTLDLARYDESLVSTSQNDGWVAADGYIYKDGSYGTGFSSLSLGSGYSYYYGSNQTYEITGSINTGQVSVPLFYDGGGTNNTNIIGFNLIGNPFTCTLNWSDVVAGNLLNPQTETGIYFTKDYTIVPTWNGVGQDGGTNLIPPMQAFFVTALPTGTSLILPPSAKTHSETSRFKKGYSADIIPLVRLVLKNDENSRDAVVRFDEKATLSFDGNFDTYKLNKSLGPINLWTRSSGIDYAINGMPYPETSIEIPVGYHAEAAGTYSLLSNELNGLENYSVTLKDISNNTTLNLKTGNSLTFSTQAGDFEDRFLLTITNVTTGTEEITLPASLFNIYAFNGILNIQLLSDNWDGKQGAVKLTDLTGRAVRVVNDVEFWKNSLIQIPVQGGKGVYIVEIISGTMRYTGKVMLR
jgi:autotransporter-associated beta strand protein